MLSTYLVDSLADVVADDGWITLREAIEAANTNAPVHDCPAGSDVEPDVIIFAESLLEGEDATATIVFEGGEFSVTDDLQVQGPTSGQLILDANRQSRLLLIDAGAEVAITDLTLSGGFADDGDPEKTDDDHGAAIFNSGTLSLSNCVLTENTAAYSGGAIYNFGTLSVRDSSFTDNEAFFSAGAICNKAAAAVVNCTFERNWAESWGGAISSGGAPKTPSLMVINSVFHANHAECGGALNNYTGQLTLVNSALVGNTAGFAGALHHRSFHDTDATIIINSTITGNSASSGGGFAISSFGPSTANVTVVNSIIALNIAESDADFGGTLGSQSTNNLIGEDPLFARNPSNGGDGWGDNPDTPEVDESANDDYGDLRLTAASPAIDAGVSGALPADEYDLDGDGNLEEAIPFDIAQNPRVADVAVDLGALERAALAGDLDGDGFVGSDDLDIVRANWGQYVTLGNLLAGDPSGDGFVGGDDLDIVRANWGDSTSSTASTLQVAVVDEVEPAIEKEEPQVHAVLGPQLPIETPRRTIVGPLMPEEILAQDAALNTVTASSAHVSGTLLAKLAWAREVERVRANLSVDK